MDHGGTVRTVLEHHRAESGMAPDGGTSDRWVVLRLGRIRMPFLNTYGRRRALALHDVNHLVAGTSSGNVGEAEISAWELASGGCGKYVTAWALDLAGMLLGLVWPIRVLRAFTAGREMTNVYALDVDEVMKMDLLELRELLHRPTGRGSASPLGAVALFIGYLVIAVPIGLLFLLIMGVSLPIWLLTKDDVFVA